MNNPITFDKILELFKEAFSTDIATSEFKCNCGITYFNHEITRVYGRENILEEYRQLIKDKKPYFEVDCSIGIYEFLGKEYASCCDCIKQNDELLSWIKGINKHWEQWIEYLLSVHIKEKEFYDFRQEKLLRILNGG